MPEFLNTFPVINLCVFKKTSNIMGLLLSCSFFADKEVQIIVLKVVSSNCGCSSLDSLNEIKETYAYLPYLHELQSRLG